MDEWKELTKGEDKLTFYTKKYRQLLLQLPHLHPITKLHGFVLGLRPRIQTKVEKMNPQSNEEAMRVVEKISDIEENTRSTYGNQLIAFNNKSWTTTKNLGRGLT